MTWPLVDPNDDGIRPAGRSDECLYCRARVGQPHGQECVIVTKRIEMRVRATIAGDVHDGVWRLDEPYSWDPGLSEFHKNESSWCAGNFLAEEDKNSVEWSDAGVWEKLKAAEASGSCLCNELAFEFTRVVDGTPKRKLRDLPNGCKTDE